jgi:hypothetical protein
VSELLNNIIKGNYDLVIAEILRLNKQQPSLAEAKVLKVALEAAGESRELMLKGNAAKASQIMANFTLAMGKVDRALKDVRMGILPEALQQDELLEKLDRDFEEA